MTRRITESLGLVQGGSTWVAVFLLTRMGPTREE